MSEFTNEEYQDLYYALGAYIREYQNKEDNIVSFVPKKDKIVVEENGKSFDFIATLKRLTKLQIKIWYAHLEQKQ